MLVHTCNPHSWETEIVRLPWAGPQSEIQAGWSFSETSYQENPLQHTIVGPILETAHPVYRISLMQFLKTILLTRCGGARKSRVCSSGEDNSCKVTKGHCGLHGTQYQKNKKQQVILLIPVHIHSLLKTGAYLSIQIRVAAIHQALLLNLTPIHAVLLHSTE